MDQSGEAVPQFAGAKVSPAVYYVACLLAGFGFDLVFDVEPTWPGWARGIGGALVVGGVAIVVAGLGTLWRSGTTIDPAKRATTLVTSGIYRVSRNPAYLGWCWIYTGVALVGGSIAAMLLMPLAIICVQRLVIQREEAYLQRAFGAVYEQYRSSVRRWI